MGLFQVIAADASTVTLELPDKWTIRNRVHVSKVRRHVERHPDFWVAEPPPLPLSLNCQLHYEVEKIIDHQRIGRIGRDGRRQLQYRVRGQGYQPADNT